MNTTPSFKLKTAVAHPIYSVTPFTLLDYPHHTACILWFAGCNMRCLYCYNPEIVLGKGKISFEQAIYFLQSRHNLIDAVVFSGGECLLHKNIIQMIAKVKQMGFLVKVDTNGSKPKVLQELIADNLIDYVALDFKAMPSDFEKITQSYLFLPFEKSLQLLIKSELPFEVRSTVHSDLIDAQKLREMIQYLEKQNYQGNYYIQHFVNGVTTLGDLGYSNRLQDELFDTSNIKVYFRG